MMTILFVDDAPDMEMLLTSRYRERAEWRIEVVSSGAEALTWLDQHPDTLLVVTDLHMPEMSGFELLTRVHARFPMMLTLIISAHSDMEHIRKAMNQGAFDYITKPINFADLDSALRKAADVAASRRQAMLDIQRLRCAVQTVPIGITITDPGGRIVYVNPADAHMHGYATEELLGQPARLFAADPDQPPDAIASPWRRERRNRRKDGSAFPALLISSNLFDPHGQPLGCVTVCEDLTERKQAEAALRDTQAQLAEALRIVRAGIDGSNQTLERRLTLWKTVQNLTNS